MEFKCNSCSPSNTRSPRVFLAANVLCLLVSLLHEELRGRLGLSFESYLENGPEHLKLCLTSRVFPAHSSVVWNDDIVNVKNYTAEHEWWSDCGCAVVVEDTSRADESTASTAGDIYRWPWSRKSPVLLGGGCRSLEAIAANAVYAPQGQLRLCKW